MTEEEFRREERAINNIIRDLGYEIKIYRRKLQILQERFDAENRQKRTADHENS